MNANAPNPYLKTKIMTASPEELRLMLYEGAIRFCRQARTALDEQNFESSYNNLMRAQKIVLELSTSLNHKIAPELCDKLSALYTYIYRRLVDASVGRDTAIVTEVIDLLEYEKETWKLLMQQVGQSPERSGMERAQVAGAQQTAMSSFSTSG